MNQIDIFHNHFKQVYPELYSVTAITIILLFGVCAAYSEYHKFPILTNITGWLSIQTLFLVILLIVNRPTGRAFGAGFVPTVGETVFNNVLIIDDFTAIIKTIVLLSASSSILISLAYIRNQKAPSNSFEYIILILISTLSMLFIISSYDLVSLYLAIELQSLSFYVLAAFQRNNEFSTEAGLKYFILGGLSSGLLLFGESILYGLTGITNFEELTKLGFTFHQEGLSIILGLGLLFMLVAFLFKIGAVPFHMWTPDVYEGAPTCVTAFFAITPKIAILSLLLRLCLYTFYDLIEFWQPIIIVCSLLSMFVGTLGALNQNKIKRLFAYSSIAHIGYMLIGLATGTIEGIESLLIYIIVYILMIINAFGVILVILKEEPEASWNVGTNSWRVGPAPLSPTANPKKPTLRPPLYSRPLGNSRSFEERDVPTLVGTRRESRPVGKDKYLRASHPLWDPYDEKSSAWYASGEPRILPVSYLTRSDPQRGSVKYITDLSSLSQTNPLLAASFALIHFSNAGIPPLAGFYGKLNVFLAAVEGSIFLNLLAIAGIICSVMGAFYSIRLVKIIYFHVSNLPRNSSTQGAPPGGWARRRHWTKYEQISKPNSIILGITFFFTLFFFVHPSFLFLTTHSAALTSCF